MEEQTTDAVIHAPEATFGIPMQDLVDASFGRKAVSVTGDWTPKEIPTREEIERIEQSAAEDDDLDDGTGERTTGVEHMTPDNDPYGWIAGVEAASPEFIDTSRIRPVVPPHVLVWQHGMIEPQRFDHAVARVLPNGTLLVTPRASDVPLKGYAPGVWVTFEHVGDEYHVRPQPYLTPDQQQVVDRDRARAAARPPRGPAVQVDHYAAQEAAAETVRVIIDPIRNLPPTHEQDADDTQTVPVVKTEKVGGGVDRPFGRGVRPDAGYDGRPDGRRIESLAGVDPKRPNWFRSLWHSLRDPDWSED